MIYSRIGFCGFIDAFVSYGRRDNFSREGLEALYDYLTETSEATGHDIELDVIELCCSWSEFESAVDACKEYGIEIAEDGEAREALGEVTQVLTTANETVLVLN